MGYLFSLEGRKNYLFLTKIERIRVKLMSKLLLNTGSMTFIQAWNLYNETYRKNKGQINYWSSSRYLFLIALAGGARYQQFGRARIVFPVKKKLEEIINHLDGKCVKCKHKPIKKLPEVQE